MRTEKEMFDLILDTAKEDARVRAVYMNGSCTNPNVPKDIFQDYDIVYVVRKTKPFREDRAWIDRFGERLYMQYPEENGTALGDQEDTECFYGWRMQFTDGNRIDLGKRLMAQGDSLRAGHVEFPCASPAGNAVILKNRGREEFFCQYRKMRKVYVPLSSGQRLGAVSSNLCRRQRTAYLGSCGADVRLV